MLILDLLPTLYAEIYSYFCQIIALINFRLIYEHYDTHCDATAWEFVDFKADPVPAEI